MDSLLSIVQMPKGVPVATVAINNATNAGLLAARILSVSSSSLATQLEEYRLELNEQALAQDRELPRP
jgi:phosphoribosylaminoimidazole carboxylase PurE protein